MRVGIVGGGITGITLGYFLSQRGIPVDIFEASPELGGLAGPLFLQDGTAVDRFYHGILPSDDHLHQLCDDLGIAGEMRFKGTKNAFLVNGRISSMNSAAEFLRFPPLTPVERVRLALTIVRAQFIRDWRTLEETTVHDWLGRWSGAGVMSKLWRPMLDAKFDGAHHQIPATWMWARLVRMKSTRAGANQRESAGHLVGGYATLLNAMAARIKKAGGRIQLRCPVQEIVVSRNSASAIRTAEGVWNDGPIVSTMQAPVLRHLIPNGRPDYLESLTSVPYLGVVCPLVVLDRPLSGYWVLNIADKSIPFTGVIETTAYIDPQYTGGHHLVYLPKYTAPESEWAKMPDSAIRRHAIETMRAVNPQFDEKWIRQLLVHRERYVEPLHRIGSAPRPSVETPIDNLYLATTAQIYPALTNGESVTRHARSVADLLVDRLRNASSGRYAGEQSAVAV